MNVANRRTAGRFAFAIASAALALAMGPRSASAAIPGASAPIPGCSSDAVTIDGTPVTVTLCATKSTPQTVTVSETLASKSATLTHATTIDVLPGESSSRGIDDVPLAQLAIANAKSLHITMHYKAGAITLEHALLSPGAVPLK